MTDGSFPGLGFDPAPGEPAALEELGRACRAFADELHDDATRAAALQSGFLWNGRAAKAFEQRLQHLPRDLRRAGDAHQAAGGALLVFADLLRAHQRHAVGLEDQAREASRITPLFPGQINSELVRVRTCANQLRHAVWQDAQSCNARLQAATHDAPKPPGWFSSALDLGKELFSSASKHLGDFVRRHAGVIAAVSSVCSQIASALAVVALVVAPIPILGEAVGGAAFYGALVTGGVALLGHALLRTYAGAPLTPVVLDSVALGTASVGRAIPVGASVLSSEGSSLQELAGPGLRESLARLRNPRTALADGATSELTWGQLVVRTVAFPFDAGSAGLGVYDLGHNASRLREEINEAQRLGDEEAERLRRSTLGLTAELGYTRRPVKVG